MPIKKKNIPSVLPAGAKTIFKGAFDSVFSKCMSEKDSNTKSCDARASKIAWSAVKRLYEKNKEGKWVRIDNE